MSQSCFHCGDEIIGKVILQDEKSFCCTGCRSVYNLLRDNQLDTFYELEKEPGLKPKEANPHLYAFLDVDSIRKNYIKYEDDDTAMVTLFLPHIHCSSCIYLLENLDKLNDGVISCQVMFSQKKASISFRKDKIALSELALLLDKIGYPPKFGDELELKAKINKQFLYKLGLAGFAFGSIMLWTVPEYLGIEQDSPEFRWLPSLLSFLVSIPVILYSANEYFISAFKAIRSRSLNLDVPISIGIVALYAQSCYHIFTNDGPGYMDSFAGFVFFLLIGKWFQNKTYESLAFYRD
ncbi:MAG: heavy metal translocating P-type ATPase metal-binding domain-containing protein [Crocinitomicaceae bacterium]